METRKNCLWSLKKLAVQGSVLGPVLYAIFISPLLDLEDMSAFADDNYTIRFHKDLLIAQNQLQASITINKTCRLKIGMNIISNRFNNLNGKIDHNWLNLKYSTYKPIANAYFLLDESQHTLP